MKTKLLFTKQKSCTLYALLVFCLCFNYSWSQELVKNGTCDEHGTGSDTSNTSDNADAWDMTPNTTLNGGITSPYRYDAANNPDGWRNQALEDWLEDQYDFTDDFDASDAFGQDVDEQPGSTSSGNGGTRGVKLYDDEDGDPVVTESTRRLYQKVVGLTIGNDYNFSFDSKADSGATVDSEVYILNTEIVDEVALNTDGGVAAGIRDDFMTVSPSTTWATFTSTFTASNTFVVIYVRSLGAADESTETFWDNISLQEDITASTKDALTSKINIYPNPANDYIQIESKDVQISSFEMYSLVGQKVIFSNNLVNSRLDISSLNSGIYLLKVNTDNGSLTKKIIVE
ncbi:T9SS C-terminal target domain-containing protein [Algibacter marinivivus]|uniref:T9SS C-terminal target domain-containing protein n=1 Tax=Algibacter marinivivus TaxID=2100723 RepID=A0A2U2X316_9FLAO|nr:T9SS type A sorting domain-containing protein [Algibacter marinivivus]PWH82175.1 T9SS C-terminal target domain-containing protein [Algibacter marinivivus]